MFRFIQYGCRSFSIDASSDPTKFQDDWPSGSRLIGAWSSDFAFNVFVCQVEPLVRSIFFGRKLILKVSTVPNQFNGSISKSPVNLEFQDDWPSGSRLIGAWSLVFAPNVLVCQVAPLVKWTFFGPKLILTISGRPNRFNGSISTFLVNLKKIGQGHVFALSRDQVTIEQN